MTGDLYLLNALWIGGGIFLLLKCGPFMLRLTWRVFVLCLPFGVVALAWMIADVYRATRRGMTEVKQDDTVIPLKRTK